jgi:hypothetical protein
LVRLGAVKRILNQAEEIFPARFSVSSGPAIREKQLGGEKKGKKYEQIDPAE